MLDTKTLEWQLPKTESQLRRSPHRELPLLGASLAFGKDPLNFLQQISRDGDMVRFNLGNLPVYLLNNPDLIGEVLRDKSGDYAKSNFADELRQIIGNGLVTANGEEWRKHRQIISPVMQRKQVESYIPTITSIARRYAAKLTHGEHNLHDCMMSLTLEIIADTLFKADTAGCTHAVSRSLEKVTTHFHTIALGWQRILPKQLPTRARRGYKQESDYLDKVVSGMVTSFQDCPRDGASLLAILEQARRKGEVSQRQICDEALTMFLAGHETTALALSYTLYLLAGHPQAQQKLQQEIEQLNGNSVDTTTLARLPYTQACINEAMRIYPPIWSIIRKTTRPCRLGEQRLNSGDHLMMSQWTLGRNPDWFPEPDTFNPERWLEGPTPPRFAFIPFGGGGRKCIGDHFAMLEATLVLVELIRTAQFSRGESTTLELVPSVTLRPKHGIRLEVTPH